MSACISWRSNEFEGGLLGGQRPNAQVHSNAEDEYR